MSGLLVTGVGLVLPLVRNVVSSLDREEKEAGAATAKSAGEKASTPFLQTVDNARQAMVQVGLWLKTQGVLLAARKELSDLVIGKFRLSFSHGCIHLPAGIAEILSSYGFGSGSKIIVHGYEEKAPELANLQPLSSPSEGKTAGKLHVYPGVFPDGQGEVAILYDLAGEPIGYFRIMGGPPIKRLASDGNKATPTKKQVYTVTGSGIKGDSTNYYHATIPGGSELQFNQENKTVEYRYLQKDASWSGWEEVPNKVAKELLDPLQRMEITRTQIELVGGKYVSRTIYMGNDYGNGRPLPVTDGVIGMYAPNLVFSLEGEDGNRKRFCHTDPFEEKMRDLAIKYTVENLLTDGEIIPPQAEYDPGFAEIYPILLKIAKNNVFDPETKTFSLSCLTQQEKEVLYRRFMAKGKDLQHPVAKTRARAVAAFETQVQTAYNLFLLEQYFQTPEFTAARRAWREYAATIDPGKYENLGETLAYFLRATLGTGETNIGFLQAAILQVSSSPNTAPAMTELPNNVPETVLAISQNQYREETLTNSAVLIIDSSQEGKVVSLFIIVTKEELMSLFSGIRPTNSLSPGFGKLYEAYLEAMTILLEKHPELKDKVGIMSREELWGVFSEDYREEQVLEFMIDLLSN